MVLGFFRLGNMVRVRLGMLEGTAFCHEEDEFDLKIGIVVAILKSRATFSPFLELAWSGMRPYKLKPTVVSYLIDSWASQAETEAVLKDRGLGDLIGQARLNKARHMVKMLDWLAKTNPASPFERMVWIP
jgi:hypothetical protein